MKIIVMKSSHQPLNGLTNTKM